MPTRARIAGNFVVLVSAEDVVGVPELGAHILGFLDDLEDLRNAALTSRRFNRAAHFHLWAAIRLPYLYADPRWVDHRPFWERFSSFLGRNTSLRVEMPVVAPGLFREISTRPWEAPVSSAVDARWLLAKEGVDFFFAGLKEAVTRAPRLRNFVARDVPRVLDLVVLLQRHRPQLVSLDITASMRDTFGFLSLPAYNIDEWRFRVRNDPNYTVPLGNTVNFGLDIDLPPVFNFANLRVLALNNIQYDGRRPSPFLQNVVALLKGSPSLSHLSLSLRHRVASIAPGGQSILIQFRINNLPDGPHDALGTLCRQYQEANGRPLRLKTLTLGYGFEIRDEIPISHIGPLPRPHSLALLTGLSTLEGLHLERIHHKDGTGITELGPTHGFSLIAARIPPYMTQLPRLRKITWPWNRGKLLRLFWLTTNANLRQLIVRIDSPPPTDWVQQQGIPFPTWVGNKPRHHSHGQNVQLKGLIMPTDSMCPQEAELFLSWVPWIDGLQVLKIRMPLLTANNHDNNRNSKGRGYMQTFWRRIERMRELRELWLADGMGTWHMPEGEPARYVHERYPAEVEFDQFSVSFAKRCPRLVYVRILDRAWHITRPAGAAQVRNVTLKEVERGRLDKDIPDSFDFGTPKY